MVDIIDACKDFVGLGSAVQEQLINVYNGADLESQNSNALKMILKWARKYGCLDTDGYVLDMMSQIEEYFDDYEKEDPK